MEDSMTRPRDFLGYGARLPQAGWPSGARVAVSIVVNVEEGAELSIADGDERNEAVYEVADEVVGLPDGCMESHFEYGTRAGYWRVLDALAAGGAPAAFFGPRGPVLAPPLAAPRT